MKTLTGMYMSNNGFCSYANKHTASFACSFFQENEQETSHEYSKNYWQYENSTSDPP